MHDVQRVPKAESVMWLHKNERQLNSLKLCIGLTSFISMQENIFGSPEKQPQNFSVQCSFIQTVLLEDDTYPFETRTA